MGTAFMLLTMSARYYLRCSMFKLGLLVKRVLIVGVGKAGKTFVDNVISSPFTLRKIAGFPDYVSDFAKVQGEVRADEVVISDESVPEEFAARLAIKEVIDYTGAVFALLVFSPVMLWAAWKIKRENGGSIFFTQPRVGKGLTHFQICKFRTMIPNAAGMLEELLKNNEELRAEFKRDFKLKDDPRITNIGHTLRNASLDELPQLFNVLRGEMSLVGPHPEA